MRKVQSIFPILIVVLAAALLALPTRAPAAKLAGRVVKIGAMVPLTGKGAEWGKAAKISMEMARDEINAAGGIKGVPIKIIFYDTHTKEAEGIKFIKKLATRDKVLAVSGPCFSSLVELIFPMLERLKTPVISFCSSKPGLSKLSKWGFRNTLTSDKQLAPVVKAWIGEYKIRKVVIIHDIEDAVSKAEGTKIMPVLLKRNGVKLLGMLTYRTKDTDFSAQITKAKALNPDGIALGACYQQAAGLAKEARKQGLNVPFVGGACAGAPGFVKIAGKASEGAYMSTAAWIDDPRPKVADYLNKYKKRSGGRKPPYGGPRAYDNVYITKRIIEEKGVTNKPGDLAKDREKIRRGWQELKGYDGVSGATSMNKVGDGSGGIVILKVVGGKYIG
ncbi:MAG: ABC transporter substrate-binding protein, partial [Nitrospinota bacterium]|nr:ABC transporter substrate-binding protein [Nitrospinota bacterium]